MLIQSAATGVPPFGQWVKDRRKNLDLTQEALAKEVGCSVSSIRKIESGTLRPSRQVAELLAGALRISPEDRAAFVQYARNAPEAEASTPAWSPGSPALDVAEQVGPYNVPIPPTQLVGREREAAEVKSLLVDSPTRLVTLTGPPGTGKTRLAIQVAHNAHPDFPDGIYFVPLAPVRDPQLVVPTIASAFNVAETARDKLIDRLGTYLRDKKLLLVLDNFEQVIPAATYLADLLSVSAGLRVLVTSREELHLRGERVFTVPPLELPVEPINSLEGLAETESVALFLQRASDAGTPITLTRDNSSTIVEICQRLEGLPLAIELAAARIPILPPAALLARLEHRLPLLTGGPRDLPARQQTLRDAIGWSYDLLERNEQKLFRHLAIFAGGATLHAVEQTLAASGERMDDVLGCLASLRSKSLVRQEAREGEPRFDMLEMVREYAAEKLAEGGTGEAARDAQCHYYLELARQAEPHLTGPGQVEWFARLEEEHANIRAALECTRARGRYERLAEFSWLLSRFWLNKGYWSESAGWITLALNHSDEFATVWRARLLHCMGLIGSRRGEYDLTASAYKESEALFRQLGDPEGLAKVLREQGFLAVLRDQYDLAAKYVDEALEIYRHLDDELGKDHALFVRGYLLFAQGQYGEGRETINHVLAIYDAHGDRYSASNVRHLLAQIALNEGNHALAEQMFGNNLQFFKDIDNQSGVGVTLHRLAMVAIAQKRYDRADQLAEESIKLFYVLGSKVDVSIGAFLRGMVAFYKGDYTRAEQHCKESLLLLQAEGAPYDKAGNLVFLGAISATQGDLVRAATLAGSADGIMQSTGAVLDSITLEAQTHTLEVIHASLPDAQFEEAWEQGHKMTMQEVYDFVLKPRHGS